MTDATVSAKIAEQLAQLTLEEKAGLTSGADMWHTKAVERLGVRSVLLSDGPHGLRLQLEAGDHVGLGHSNPATCFPPAVGLACSWDAGLLFDVGSALGREARREEVHVLLGPGLNLKRHPLCGRNFEYFSEDPLLTGTLGSAMVRGIQSQGVGASAKHFAANNQETDRLRVSADIDERPLRELYLSAFEQVVREARPWTVMSSYNRINGIHASENRWLLSTVLREEWGFDGVVVSDWGGVNQRKNAVAAGNDLEMPGGADWTDQAVVAAVRDGELDEAALDDSATRMLLLAHRAHEATEAADVDFDAHHDLALTAATRSAVLLKNDDSILPIDPAADDIALIGEFAERPRFQGAGSSQVNPIKVVNAVDAFRDAFPSDGIRYARGFDTVDASVERAASLVAESVQLARSAKTVVLFLGLPESVESEGFDREAFGLPAAQITLLKAVAAVNDRIIVVLCNGGTVDVGAWDQHATAILEAWLPGQAGGSAIVDLLTGRATPSGKLAETIPHRIQDVPSYVNFPGREGHVRYGEGVFVGYRYYDTADVDVAYPFGFGLSYTTFEYSALSVTENGPLDFTVAFTITNTGDRAGREVAQVYVTDPTGSEPVSPTHELRGFATATLQPGESATVEVVLSARAFSSWSIARGGWAVDPGTRTIQVGASSRDIRLSAEVVVESQEPAMLTLESTIAEWMAHPVGGPILTATAEASEHHMLRMMIDSEESFKLVSGVPIFKVETFAPGEFSAAELLEKVAASADASDA